MTNLAPHPTFDLLDNLMSNLMRPSATAGTAARFQHARMIPVDVHDSADQYRITADLPGIQKDAIELTVDGSRVVLSATSAVVENAEQLGPIKTLVAERFAGKWRRTIELPEELDDERVSATLKDGVLELLLPKKTPRGIRRVQIA